MSRSHSRAQLRSFQTVMDPNFLEHLSHITAVTHASHLLDIRKGHEVGAREG